MVKQSPTDRLKRLSEGRCPIHGCALYPEHGEWKFRYWKCDHCDATHQEVEKAVHKCERKACEIRTYQAEGSDVHIIFPKWKHLFE